METNPENPKGDKLESYILLIAFDDEQKLLQEAKKHKAEIKLSSYKKVELDKIEELAQQKKKEMGISRIILRNENKILLSSEHAKNKFDLYKYLSEADRVRMSF